MKICPLENAITDKSFPVQNSLNKSKVFFSLLTTVLEDFSKKVIIRDSIQKLCTS